MGIKWNGRKILINTKCELLFAQIYGNRKNLKRTIQFIKEAKL